MSDFFERAELSLLSEAQKVEAYVESIFSPAPVAPATATQPESQETNHMATTETATLTISSAEFSAPLVITLDKSKVTLPVSGSVTVTATSPVGSLTETVTADINLDGFALPAFALGAFPLDLTGTVGTVLAEIVKAIDATIVLAVVAA